MDNLFRNFEADLWEAADKPARQFQAPRRATIFMPVLGVIFLRHARQPVRRRHPADRRGPSLGPDAQAQSPARRLHPPSRPSGLPETARYDYIMEQGVS